MKRMLRNFLAYTFLLAAVLFSTNALAQLNVTAFSTTYTIDFDAAVAGVNGATYAGTGFTAVPVAGQLDADAWATTGMSDGAKGFGVVNTAGDHARGSSAVGQTTGGFWAFTGGSISGSAFGVQPVASDWTPGTLTLRIVNNTGATIGSFDLAYIVHVRNNENRANSFNFSYSSNNTTYTTVPALDLTSPEALVGGAPFVANNRNTTITGLSVAPGAFFYLRWSGDDVSGANNRDEFALDDIQITAYPSYCASNFTNVSFEYISNVTYAGINNNSVGITGGPVNYTAQVASVFQGATNQISVTIDPDANDYIYAFIDWNQNGTLNDGGEVYTIAGPVGTAGPHTLNITVPGGAALGNTRMRVMLDWNNAVPDPCRNATYGEAEDYTVNVAAPSCTSPAATATVVETDCNTGTFTINVNLTSIGDATNVDIVEDVNGGGANVVHDDETVLTTYVLGPYNIGDAVDVTVTHNQDGTCDLPVGTYASALVCQGVCGLNISIPDNGCPTTLDISFPASTVAQVLGTNVFVESVDLIIPHTWIGDLNIQLTSPNNVTVDLALINTNGHWGGDDNLGDNSNCPTAVFQLMDGGTPLGTGTGPNIVGSFDPDEPLSTFHDGSDPNGNWILRICDAANLDIGTVQYFKINFIDQPTYYSQSSGSETTATWDIVPVGTPGPATFNPNASMIIQAGHTVTTTGANFDVRNLTVQTGGTLILTGTTQLGVYGTSLDLTGGFTANNSNVSLLGTAAATITGTTPRSFYDLTVNNAGGVTNSLGFIDILRTLQLDNGNYDNNGNRTTLKSDINGTARMGTVGGGASYTGNIVMERYIPAGVTNWRLLGMPVTGPTLEAWDNDFITSGIPNSDFPNFTDGNGNIWPSLYHYDESLAAGAQGGPHVDTGFVAPTNMNNAYVTGRGFWVWCGDSLSGTDPFTINVGGAPNIGSVPLPLQNSMPLSPTAGDLANRGWNVVANPLPSPVDFGAIFKGGSIQNKYWIYNPVTGNTAEWDETSSTSTPSGILNGGIQSSQAFWLHAFAQGPISAVVEEADKVTDAQANGLFGGSQQFSDMLRFRLKLSKLNSTFYDEALIRFDDMGNANVDSTDGIKLWYGHPQAPRIASLSADSIDMIHNNFGELNAGVQIPVRVRPGINGQHTITVHDMENLGGITCLVLEDLVTGISTPIQEGSTYTFTMGVNAPNTLRFIIHVADPVIGSVTDVSCAGVNDGSVEVQGAGSGPWDYTWMDNFGNTIAQELGSTGSSTLSGLAAGTYMVSVDGSASCGQLTHTITIDEPAPIDAQYTTSASSCSTVQDGAIDLMPMGGTEPLIFDWSNGATTEDLNGVGAGMYSVTITDANSCTFSVNDMEVTAGQGPVANAIASSTDVLVNEEIDFFNMSTFGAAYHWDFGDGNTSIDSEPTHSYTLPGNYTVTLTVDQNGCIAIITIDISVSTSTDVAEMQGGTVNAYSANNVFVVDWNVQVNTGLQLMVYDLDGRMVGPARALNGAKGQFRIDMRSASTGIYFLRAIGEDVDRAFRLPVVR